MCGPSPSVRQRRPRSEPGIGPVIRGSAAVAASVVAVVAAAACAAEQAPRYGAGLEEAVAAALVPDAPDWAEVSCPEFDPAPEAEAGEPPVTVALDCEAMVGGVPVAVAVRVTGQWMDMSADVFLVDVADLEEAAADRLSADLGPTQADCGPDPVLVSEPGASLVCHAYDEVGRPHLFVITVTSETGDWELNLGRPAG